MSAGEGHRCTICGSWLSPGTLHGCAGSSPNPSYPSFQTPPQTVTTFVQTDPALVAVLQRLADILERLADQPAPDALVGRSPAVGGSQRDTT